MFANHGTAHVLPVLPSTKLHRTAVKVESKETRVQAGVNGYGEREGDWEDT